MRKLFRLIWMVPATMALAACGVQENFEVGNEEINSFHLEYNAEEIDAIWDNSGPAMKKAVSKAELTKFLSGVRQALGKKIDSKRTGWRVQATPQGNMTVITTKTTFEHGEGAETFTFMSTGDRVELAGYNINSQDMMRVLMENASAEEGEALDADAGKTSGE